MGDGICSNRNQHGQERWYFKYRDSTGKSSTKRGFTSHRAAQRAKRELDQLSADGELVVTVERFGELFDRWLAERRPYLEYFAAAAEAGSMTGAAEELHVSQSAVSLAIRELERLVGAQLFIRDRAKGLGLTASGRELLADARSLLTHAGEIQARAQSPGEQVSGRLTVGCSVTAGPFYLPQVVPSFLERYPSVEIEILEGPTPWLENALTSGACEVAIVYDLAHSTAVDADRLFGVSPHVLAARGHPLEREFPDGVPLAALADQDLVMLDVDPAPEFITGMFAAIGKTPRIRYRSSNFELIRSLVARGLGYAFLHNRPRIDVSYEGLPLTMLELEGPAPTIDISFLTPAGVTPTRRCRAFVDHCRSVLLVQEPADHPHR